MKLIALLNVKLLVAICMMSDPVNSRCSSTEFLTEEGHCCRNPQPSYYIIKNCTLETSISAKPCSTCSGKGMKILANCTRFSDTKCGCADNCSSSDGRNNEDGVTRNPVPTCAECYKNMTKPTPYQKHIVASVIAAPVIAGLLLAGLIALIWVICYHFQKCRKTGEFLKVPNQV